MDKKEQKFYKEVVSKVICGRHPFNFVYQMHAKNIDGDNIILNSAECLSRIADFKGKKVNPYLFFKTISELAGDPNPTELSNRIREFLFFQLDKLCSEIEDVIDDLGRNFVVTFNVSPEFFDDEFKKAYLKIIANHPRIAQKNIAIELTEIGAFPINENQKKEKKEFIRSMKELQRGGTIIALDDFNSDYADSKTLKAFPWDVVKIDSAKFAVVIDQILKPNFNMHFANLENTKDGNVLDVLASDLESMQLHDRPLPKKIICEGLREGTCPDNAGQNIPKLIAKYYGKTFHSLGYDKTTFLYQGYEINIPFAIEDMVEILKSSQVNLKDF